MLKLWQKGILLSLALAILGSLMYWWGTPRLLEVYPPQDAVISAAQVQLRLRFSRRMNLKSLQMHLSISPPVPGSFAWQENTLIFTPETPWPAGTRLVVSLSPGARAEGLLPFPMIEEKTWSFSLRQPLLAYLFPSSGPANIYVLDPQTRQVFQITFYLSGVLDFHVRTDGQELYYSVHGSSTGSEIYRLPLVFLNTLFAPHQEEDIRAVLPDPELVLRCQDAICRAVAVSPDGSYIAFERVAYLSQGEENYPRVWYLKLNTASETQDSPAMLDIQDARPVDDLGHQSILPSWSPQGWLTYYDTQEAAFIIFDPRDNRRWRFPNQTGQPGSWHPRGEEYVAAEILFPEPASSVMENVETFASSHLLVYAVNSSRVHDLSIDERLEDTAPSFSPDGRYLAFARKYLDVQRWTPGRQLWLMDYLTQQATQLTDAPLYNHFDIAWSPAGDRLAFVRFNKASLTEPPELWIMHPFETWMVRLVIGGYFPQWIP